MAGIFGGPPQVQALPPPPSRDNKDVAAEMEKAAAIERRAKGRSATLLTGGDGVTEQASISKRMLLGS